MGTTTTSESRSLEPTAITTTQSAPMSGITPSHADSHALPDEPLVIIRAGKRWSALNLRDVWAYRELFYFLSWRDVKVRYKQTVLGVTWAVLQPLLMMLIFTLFFGQLAGIASDKIPYPIFAYAGLLPWTFFANATNNSGNSIVGSANLITKVYFPRMIIPGAAVGAGLVDLLLGFAMLAPLMLYYHVPLRLSMLMLAPLVMLLTLLALGVGMWMSALNVKYRDVRFALPFLIQLWMFASPIIYPLSNVPARWQWLLALNPMTGIIQGFRSSLFGHSFNWLALAFSAVTTLVVLVYAAYSFRRMEKSFADIV
jgi:lipopolysaccharide transport system permease protein